MAPTFRSARRQSCDTWLRFVANQEPLSDGTWLDQSDTNFDQLIPLIEKVGTNKKAIFAVSGLGVSTNRDAWLLDFDEDALMAKVGMLSERYASSALSFDPSIKWSETLKRHRKKGADETTGKERIRKIQYRSFCSKLLYDSNLFIDRRGVLRLDQAGAMGLGPWLAISAGRRSNFGLLASSLPPSLDHFVPNGTIGIPHFGVGSIDNITDWALKQFKDCYGKASPPQPSPAGRGSNEDLPARGGSNRDRPITKQAIFHYVYAVLHDPLYREKYAQNLKREFPRIPFYADFWQWVDWGFALMDLHIGYESVEPWPVQRHDVSDEKARKNGAAPKAMLKADKDNGRIVLDSETTLAGIPPEVWDYKLGNRSALEWILDQYKEKKPKDPTIREKFNTYRFADYKEKVIDLLARVTRVSVATQEIVGAMRAVPR